MIEREVDSTATAVVDASADVRHVDGVLFRVRTRLPEFTGALQRVAEQVLTDPAAAARATIVELAERSGTSPATVTRFCRALGFDGLRRPAAGHRRRDRPAPARPAGPSTSAARSSPTDPLDRVLGQIMAADTRAMHDTAALLDLAEVERAADAIAARHPGRHLRRQRQRAGRRGDAVQPAPHRRRRVGLDRRAQRAGQRRAAARRRRRARRLAQRRDPARRSRCSPRPAAAARPPSR